MILATPCTGFTRSILISGSNYSLQFLALGFERSLNILGEVSLDTSYIFSVTIICILHM